MTSCDSCHLDDDPHDGVLGTQCASCHTEVNWQDPVFFDHDFTQFPLHGVHQEQDCDSCHTTQAYANESVDCVSCHLDDDTHKGNFGDGCNSCHNPVAWDIWTFDHDVQTDFPLDGAHVNVGCDDCHRTTLDKVTAIDGSCRDCHRADDIHDGEFGADAGVAIRRFVTEVRSCNEIITRTTALQTFRSDAASPGVVRRGACCIGRSPVQQTLITSAQGSLTARIQTYLRRLSRRR